MVVEQSGDRKSKHWHAHNKLVMATAILFWIWNILDARPIAASKTFTILPGILLAAIIIYVIAWQVTGVSLDRLVKRFNDARIVATNLLNPDVITISVKGQDQICAWSCMSDYIGDKLAGGHRKELFG